MDWSSLLVNFSQFSGRRIRLPENGTTRKRNFLNSLVNPIWEIECFASSWWSKQLIPWENPPFERKSSFFFSFNYCIFCLVELNLEDLTQSTSANGCPPKFWTKDLLFLRDYLFILSLAKCICGLSLTALIFYVQNHPRVKQQLKLASQFIRVRFDLWVSGVRAHL